ncbi:MAG: hypothetical protein NDI69_15755 [Bacteriovoracaceae bacterium]|nr:hypothetical protein [Bacteriovoracaceae bacterium]
MMRILQLLVGLICFGSLSAFGADSLSYSGRLVNANGSPVTGPVNLKFDLAYTNDLTVIKCTQQINNIDLINGVFHAKLNLDCSPLTLTEVLENIPLNNSIAIRVTDLTPSTPKVYSYQALHSLPFSIMSEMSKQLVQMGANAGQVLTWNGTQWTPADPAGTMDGVTTIVGSDGLSAVRVDETVTIGIADGGVTAAKLDQMGAGPDQVLKWNGSTWAPADDVDTGLTTEVDPTVRAFARNDVTGIAPEICNNNQVLRYISVDNSLRCFDLVDDAIVDGETSKAPSQNAVFDALALKQNTIDNNSELMMKSVRVTNDGSTWVGIKAPNAAGNLYFTLPAGAGVNGQVLKTDGVGNLSWVTPSTTSSSIVDGSIVDVDIAVGAEIAQSKIAGLPTSLLNLDSRITNLTTDDIAEGSRLYFTEARALGSNLTGLDATNGAITSADTVLSSIGKLIGNVAVVSTAQSNYLLKSGDTMTGNLQMGGNALTGLAVPSGDTDAATKKYVDDVTAAGSSKWTKSVNDIYYTLGNVGIGTSSPSSMLDVAGQVRATSFKQVPTIQTVKGLTWSRIVDLNEDSVLGTSFILSISGTRSNVVWNSTWLVNTSHALDGFLTLLSSTDYTQSRLRLVINNNGGGFVEFYDQGTGATAGVDQSLKIIINNYVGGSAVLTSFQDGTDSTGFTVLPAVTSIPGGIISQGGASFLRGIQIGTDSATCDSTKPGTLRYNSGNVEYCNGSSWLAFGVSGAGITSLNGSNSVTQSFAVGSSGSAPTWSTAGGVHTINIPLASAASVTAGLLSKADHDIFNAKLGTASTFSGDVSGTYNSTSVDKLKGTSLVMSSLSSGNILKFNGTNWVNAMLGVSDIPNLDTSKMTSGTLPVSRGGTNISSLSGNRIMVSSATSIMEAPALSDGQILIGSTGGAPIVANLTAGSGVTITNSSGGISISATGSGGTVTNVSGNAPLSVATGTTTPVISISQANSSANGYLSSTDWTTFNNKQNSLASGATINGIVYPANTSQTLQIPLAPVNLTDAVNKQYVDSFGQWSINGSSIYRSSGSVGIGTSSPSSSLNVVGTGGGNDDVMIDSITESGEGTIMLRRARGIPGAPTKVNANDRLGFMTFRGYTGTTYADLARVQGSAAADLDITVSGMLQFFTTDAGSNTEKMRITSGGNVGIGTSAPASKLHVQGAANFGGSFSNNNVGMVMVKGDGPSQGVTVWNESGPTTLRMWTDAANDTGHLTRGDVGTSGISITGNARIGIGTTQPNAKLEVSAGTDPVAIRLTETTGAHANWELRSYNVALAGADNQFSIWGGIATGTQTDRLVIAPSGNVGIGVNAPTTKLEVSGTVKATNFQGTLNGIKMGAGEFVFANGACGNTVATACSISIASVGFSGVPACTITMRNRDATSYTEKMVIKDITASAITIWRGNYPDSGTTMQGYWTCMGN